MVLFHVPQSDYQVGSDCPLSSTRSAPCPPFVLALALAFAASALSSAGPASGGDTTGKPQPQSLAWHRSLQVVRNVVRPDSTRSSVPASRPAAPSSCRPAGTPIPCRAFLRPRLRNHAFSPVPRRPTRKALDLDPTTGCGKSIGPRFPSSPVWLRFTYVVLSLHRSTHCSW
jgi:hypothetical protein